MIALLEQGTVPWRKPWRNRGLFPRKMNGTPYRGINFLILMLQAEAAGYESPLWLTGPRIEKRGGRLLPDQHPTEIVFWRILEQDEDDVEPGQKPRRIPIMRMYRVYNLQQAEGVSTPKWLRRQETAQPPDVEHDPIEDCERIIRGYRNGPRFEEGGNRAAYAPSLDLVRMPPIGRFESAESYYHTRFHELAHSTGHRSRLNREGLMAAATTHDVKPYSFEELVAELAASYLDAEAGIAPATIENAASYLAGWLEALRADSRMVLAAAGAAQRAADLILGMRATAEEDEAA